MKHQTHNTGNEYKKVNNEVLMCHCSGTDNNWIIYYTVCEGGGANPGFNPIFHVESTVKCVVPLGNILAH